MSEKKSGFKKGYFIIIAAVVVLAIAGYFMFNAGMLGGNSCEALLRRYNRAGKVEDYTTINEVFPLMMEKGCDFE